MKAVLLMLCAWWISAAIGNVALSRFGILRTKTLERFTYASAVGLGIAAYGILVLGLIGQLAFWPVTIWWIILGASGITGSITNINALKVLMMEIQARVQFQGALTFEKTICSLLGTGIIFCLILALIGCFLPPSSHAWDALAYHLADPKIFLQTHRITSLPAEHHSNFPFTLEMLYAAGLLYEGVSLANLFHFLTLVLTVLGIIGFVRRSFGVKAAYISAFLYVSTPIVLWEASVAYIDVGLALYVSLAFWAALSMLDKGDGGRVKNTAMSGWQWALLAGISMGFALGIKYLALLPLFIIGLQMLITGVNRRNIAIYFGIAFLIGSPWYIKNTILTHNPVYPFLYKYFPGSLYWSQDRAIPYEGEQKSFGFSHELSRPQQTIPNIILSPWNLASEPTPWYPLDRQEKHYYTNLADLTFTSLIGGLYTGFIFALLTIRPIPIKIRALILSSGLLFLAWFFISQHIRYLIPSLSILTVICGYAASRFFESRKNRGLMRIVTCGALAGQFVVLAWGLFVLPSYGRPARNSLNAGAAPTALSIPEALSAITSPAAAQELRMQVDNQGAIEWINANTSNSDSVLLLEEVRGFYLNRPYTWGNRDHSSFIPYDKMEHGAELNRWLTEHQIHYVLINLNLSPFNQPMQQIPDDENVAREIIKGWYITKGSHSDHWRKVIAEAMVSGGWNLRFIHHGVAVMEIPRASE